MEHTWTELEFFDWSNASEDDVKEIRAILGDAGSNNGSVELPWDLPLSVHNDTPDKCSTPGTSEEPCEPTVASSNACSSTETVVGQTLVYTPTVIPQQVLSAPAPQLPISSSDVMPSVETFMPQMPPLSAASAIASHYGTPYFVPRTLPYLRAYPPVGLPIVTYTLPGSGELTHVPSPYAPFLPLATPAAAIPHQPRLDKPVDKEESEIRQKTRGPSDRQYNRRTRKKTIPGNNYYSTSNDYGHSSESYPESIEDQTLIPPPNVGSDRLPTVPSSLPVVPVHMPSTFPVTSGALPMHSYPPGLHPLSYSQIPGHQPPSTPLYYVPVFNHPTYSGYLSSASAPMMLPMGSVSVPSSIHPASESECSVTNECAEDVTKSSESLVASSSESAEKTSESSINVESDCESSSLKKNNQDTPTKTESEIPGRMVEVPRKIEAADNCSPESTDTLVEANTPIKSIRTEGVEKNVSRNAYHGNSRCWADLFKNRCTEINGLDRRPVNNVNEGPDTKEQRLKKDINGKLHNVPNSDNIL